MNFEILIFFLEPAVHNVNLGVLENLAFWAWIGYLEWKLNKGIDLYFCLFIIQVGDLPDADIKPPENVLFVCKLNPVTTDEDLEIIFSRFGPIRR